jgi:hypothetical protein
MVVHHIVLPSKLNWKDFRINVSVHYLHALLVLLVHKVQFLEWFWVNQSFENLKPFETCKLENFHTDTTAIFNIMRIKTRYWTLCLWRGDVQSLHLKRSLKYFGCIE